jgi:phage tail protein X
MSRYSKYPHIQPKRKIPIAISDVTHTFTQFDTVDKLAYKYYGDATLGWIIMCANPDYFHEFEIKNGDKIRIPLPLERVWQYLGVNGEI